MSNGFEWRDLGPYLSGIGTGLLQPGPALANVGLGIAQGGAVLRDRRNRERIADTILPADRISQSTPPALLMARQMALAGDPRAVEIATQAFQRQRVSEAYAALADPEGDPAASGVLGPAQAPPVSTEDFFAQSAMAGRPLGDRVSLSTSPFMDPLPVSTAGYAPEDIATARLDTVSPPPPAGTTERQVFNQADPMAGATLAQLQQATQGGLGVAPVPGDPNLGIAGPPPAAPRVQAPVVSPPAQAPRAAPPAVLPLPPRRGVDPDRLLRSGVPELQRAGLALKTARPTTKGPSFSLTQLKSGELVRLEKGTGEVTSVRPAPPKPPKAPVPIPEAKSDPERLVNRKYRQHVREGKIKDTDANRLAYAGHEPLSNDEKKFANQAVKVAHTVSRVMRHLPDYDPTSPETALPDWARFLKSKEGKAFQADMRRLNLNEVLKYAATTFTEGTVRYIQRMTEANWQDDPSQIYQNLEALMGETQSGLEPLVEGRAVVERHQEKAEKALGELRELTTRARAGGRVEAARSGTRDEASARAFLKRIDQGAGGGGSR